MRIAVVIPTLNEAGHVGPTLASLESGRPELVVVADCDSADATAEQARAGGAHVLTGRGLDHRAAALQAGVEFALQHFADHDAPPPDVFWFLHADTPAPAGWRDAIEATLADPAVVGGAFTQRFATTPPPPPETPREAGKNVPGSRLTWVQRRLLRFACFANRTRYRVTGITFGDQGQFVRPAALAQIGGVPQIALMEDVELCKQLRRIGKLRVNKLRISTSPRRFLKHGIVRQLLSDWWLLLNHRLGLRPAKAYEKYNADNRTHAETPAPAGPAASA